ncbi:uncharacterized protein LOC134289800 [Aedes albopictus]|uniref:Endonuclease n=1 Tax=Aedes albopictus TaxID=7160 RepID=A0ABM1YUW0_AEDAL
MSEPHTPEVEVEPACNYAACEHPDKAGEFVQCDKCGSWWHFTCAGVTGSIADRAWSCSKCTTTSIISPGGEGSASVLARNLTLLRERHEREKKRMELELQRKFLDEQQRLLDISAAEDVGSTGSRVLNDWLNGHEGEEGAVGGTANPPAASQIQPPGIPKEPDAVQVIKDLQAQLAYYQRASVMPPPPQNQLSELNRQLELCRAQLEKLNIPDSRPVAGRPNATSTPPFNDPCVPFNSERPLQLPRLFSQGAVPKHIPRQAVSRPEPVALDSSVPPAFAEPRRPPVAHPVNSSGIEGSNYSVGNPQYRRLGNYVPPNVGPTQQQLAARQSLGRDLPVFSGNPADWPIFVSNYNYTTAACGFTDGENMLRLQRCLKGAALESVRSRLILPAATPQVIETLRMRYGRPELLINALLEKVRSIPAPRSDRLDGLIEFGVAVQSLCDHIEAANEHDHLSNPSLVQELVSKLPADQKLMWAGYKRGVPIVNLKTFSDYMMEVVEDASSVISFEPEVRKPAKKVTSKGFINSHNADVPEEASGPKVAKQRECMVCSKSGHYVKECGIFKAYTVDERWRKVRALGLCQNCLFGHGRRSCRIASRCNVDGCQLRHHSLLHSAQRPTQVVENHTHQLMGSKVLFRIIPVTLHGPAGAIDTFAFLDEGSSLTLIESELANQLGVHGHSRSLCLRWTGNTSRVEHKSQAVTAVISGSSMKQRYTLRDAQTVESLNLPTQSFLFDEALRQFGHLKGLPIQSYHNAKPKILIGVDNLRLAVPLRIKEGPGSDLIATKTRLGWCVYGRQQGKTRSEYSLHICECSCDDKLQDSLKEFYAIEEVGVKPPETIMSNDDRRAWDLMKTITKRVGNRYETGLLWIKDDIEFPQSYGMAVRRLQCLERRMERNPKLKENLHRQIAEYQEKAYAHKVTPGELSKVDAKKIWFLPIGAVINPKKPDKVRIVLDAAAKVKGMSLNSFLLKGPDQLVSLLAVFFNFRLFAVAVTADIREMFHQLRIRQEDKYAQCFLWRVAPNDEPETYVMDVAIFGAACSPALAQYAKNTNAIEHADRFPRAAQGILKSTYVDDYLDSFGSVEEAKRIATEVRMVNEHGGFDLRNWRSNSRAVMEHMGETEVTHEQKICLSEDRRPNASLETERVLGMLWDPSKDQLFFCTRMNDETTSLINEGARPTKRQILRCVMSLFDPLGLLSPFVIHGKVLVQDLWRAGLEWDEPVGDGAFVRWRKWIDAMEWVATIRIPRCYFALATECTYCNAQLHAFADASPSAYSCAVYLRIVGQDGIVQCTLVAAKAKVAPLKPLSVPRLELQACVLAARLIKFVETNHPIVVAKRFLWTDSRTAYSWIRADPRNYRPFVAHRVGEILETTQSNEWRWLPSEDNPADEATKWGSCPYINADSQWFSSSRIMYQPEEQWPDPAVPHVDIEDEIRPCVLHHVEVHHIIEYERFSKWERLRNTMVYVLRFRNNIDKRRLRTVGSPSQQELKTAEEAIIRMVQLEAYPDEVAIIGKNSSLPREKQQHLHKSSSIHKLVPFMDECGILRQNSRIAAAEQAAFGLRFPMILPKQHLVTKLIVEHHHRRFRHAFAETVVNELRQTYAIPKLRSLVRLVSRACLICQLKKSRPAVPPMAPLPPARLAAFVRPFSYVGVDYFGPLLVKLGRSNAKRWIALFTCLTVRAIHLEVAFNLSTDSCISCVRRFVCRRGSPIEFISDNGTNFRGADRILRNQINSGLTATFTNSCTKWSFNPPGAPHMGGAWERLVRSVKSGMEGAYSEGKLDDEGLQTLILEIESIVNGRPLTYLPLESAESEALTPNHFLLGSSMGTKVPSVEIPTALQVRGSYDMIQRQLNHFWVRWVKEYLPVIRRQPKWFLETKPVRKGDLVLIADEGSRNGWIRGMVQEVTEGIDGRIRQATVKTSSGILRRPVSKLAVLDVINGSAVSEDVQMHSGEDVDNKSVEMATLVA